MINLMLLRMITTAHKIFMRLQNSRLLLVEKSSCSRREFISLTPIALYSAWLQQAGEVNIPNLSDKKKLLGLFDNDVFFDFQCRVKRCVAIHKARAN